MYVCIISQFLLSNLIPCSKYKTQNRNSMFSCFCGQKKRQSLKKIEAQLPLNDLTSNIKHSRKNYQPVNTEITVNMKNSKQKKVSQKLIKMQRIDQPPKNGIKIQKAQSLDSEQQLTNQILDSQLDSQTVPYVSKKQVSQVSTQGRKKAKKENTNYIKPISEEQKIRQYRFSKTNNQTQIHRFFSIDPQSYNFMSRQNLKNQHKPTIDIKHSASIDYSRYSQQDKQIPSSQILDMNEEIQSKLHELQVMDEEKQRSEQIRKKSNTKNERQNLTGSQNRCSKFKKALGFDNIENDFGDLEQAQNQIHHTIEKNSKVLMKSTYKGSLKNVKFCISAQSNQDLNQGDKRQNSLKQFVQKTIQTELDCIEQDPNRYFCETNSLRAPQSLTSYKKSIPQQTEFSDNIMDETLEEAENAFDCDSINQEFSRSIITKQYDLAMKIFSKMTLEEKNSKDPKGYYPAHLAILQAIVDNKAFQMAKKIIYLPQIRLDIKGPTGWNPLQESISYKHLRLTPHIFVSSHRKKLKMIKEAIASCRLLFASLPDFQLTLSVKIDSSIPLVGTLTPNDNIIMTKIGSNLLIDYTLVGYEYLSCKRRDMGFLLNGQTLVAINRSKGIYCDLLQELDKQEIQLICVDALQCETKKVDPLIKKVQMKQARTLFDNQVIDKINSYQSLKYTFQINYTSMTEKRMPSKRPQTQNGSENNQTSLLHDKDSPLNFLSSWQSYRQHKHEVKIKPKNKNKKIQLQMWLSSQFQLKLQNLLQIFQLFALCNPLAKIISQFLNTNLKDYDELLTNRFPVKIDIPINFSLYFNLQFKDLKFDNFKKKSLKIQENLNKISRKQFQNIQQSKQKRSFAMSAFT